MRSLAVVVLALVATAACGSGSSYSSAPPPQSGCTPTATKVCMQGTLFVPATLNVARGASVTWQNGDGFAHTTTSNPANPAACPTWDHTVSGGGSSPAVSFPSSGPLTCQYYCRFHATPNSGPMRATITVQ
jgi:plastocyanin